MLRGDARVFGAQLQPVELGAVAPAQAHGGLLRLHTQLLLCILALLDTAQLAIALGELSGSSLALELRLNLAVTQVRKMGLECANGRLGGLRATQQSRVAEPRAAGTPLSERIALTLPRGTVAGRLFSLGYHCDSEYGRDRTGIRDSHLLPLPHVAGPHTADPPPRLSRALLGRAPRGAAYPAELKPPRASPVRAGAKPSATAATESSMNPGEAVCGKRPPDSEKVASRAS